MSISGGYVEKNSVNLILPKYYQTERDSEFFESFQEENCAIQAMTWLFQFTRCAYLFLFKLMKPDSHCKKSKRVI